MATKDPSPIYARFPQFLLISAFTAFSWLAMQVVHEFGHVFGAAVTGGEVTGVHLHPLAISRTDVYPNPHPLLVVWAGPLVGVILPLVFALIARVFRWPIDYLFQFFAGFCLVVNGAYIGVASIQGGADGGDIVRHGSSLWQPVAFGVVAVVFGLFLWNGLGPKFGLGAADGQVDPKAVCVAVTLLVVLAGIEVLLR